MFSLIKFKPFVPFWNGTQMPSFWHGLEAHAPIKLVLQAGPVYDDGHEHSKEFEPFLIQVPPLKHGRLEHGSLLVRDESSQ